MFPGMRFRLANLLVAMILVLALSLGSVAQIAMAAELSPSIAAPSVTVQLEDCDACGGDAAMADVDCYAVCTSSAALASPLPAKTAVSLRFDAFITPSQASWRANPDPFPPRSHVLS